MNEEKLKEFFEFQALSLLMIIDDDEAIERLIKGFEEVCRFWYSTNLKQAQQFAPYLKSFIDTMIELEEEGYKNEEFRKYAEDIIEKLEKRNDEQT